jgi:S-formylglutathione hydrolase
MYKSVSAFAPVSNPTKSPWGVKAFTAFLGSDNEQQWNKYDATELAKVYKGPSANILIDQV